MEPVAGVYPLGVVLGSGRGNTYTQDFLLAWPGRSSVRTRTEGPLGRSPTHVALSVPSAWIFAGVATSDGRPVAESSASLYTWCDSVPELAEAPPDQWQRLPIQAEVHLGGHAVMKFTWHLGDPVERRVLERLPPSETHPVDVPPR